MFEKTHLLRIAAVLAAAICLALPSVTRAGSNTIVIAEFRTRGPAGASDEFIELFNRSAAAVDVSGWELWGSNGSGGTAQRATVPQGTVIPAGCRLLLAQGSSYSGLAAPDLSYGTAIADDGGIALCSGPCDQAGSLVDQVGMSAGSAYGEGTPLAPLTVSQEQSYERQPAGVNDQDGDDNNADFLLNAGTSNPQNAAGECTPLAVTLASFTATCSAGDVLITWETASELDNLGFNLWRGRDPDFANAEFLAFIPSQAPGSGQGFPYTYRDSAVQPGVHHVYWLEAVGMGGDTTRHGPVSTICEAPTAVTLHHLSAESDNRSPRAIPLMLGLAVLVLVAARAHLR